MHMCTCLLRLGQGLALRAQHTEELAVCPSVHAVSNSLTTAFKDLAGQSLYNSSLFSASCTTRQPCSDFL